MFCLSADRYIPHSVSDRACVVVVAPRGLALCSVNHCNLVTNFDVRFVLCGDIVVLLL